MLLTGLAGGLAWGIRGQYGHETGAMIAGVLVSLTLILMLCPRIDSLRAARAIALMAVGISFGGSMTYGQTIGLTHDAPLVGHHGALLWGLLGLFLKGGIWIALGALFLGIGLSRKRYTAWELTTMLCVAVLLLLGGVVGLNQPFDPLNRLLPQIYFSDHWRWEPDGDLIPRRERWGGLIVALAGFLAYVTLVKRDPLARQLTLWGFLAGGIGFAGGQCLQAAHAWHPAFFDETPALAPLTRHLNWWNLMETTFGFLFGVILALGVWRNRRHLAGHPDAHSEEESREEVSLREWAEGLLLAIHLSILIPWNFLSIDRLDRFADLAVTMGILPVLGIMSGRWWPYLFALPVVALPIAGKTIRELSLNTETIPLVAGICVYGIMPLFLVTSLAVRHAQRPSNGALPFVREALVLMAWTYFFLNWAFFRYPWPWEPWTGRTPHGLSYLVATLALTLAAVCLHRDLSKKRAPQEAKESSPERPPVPWAEASPGRRPIGKTDS